MPIRRVLNSPAAMRRIDRSDMLELIAGLPAQFGQGFQTGWALPARWPRTIAQVVFVGMGGSAISGDLVKTMLQAQARVPINVLRTYDLPAYVSSHTLVIASSYSGDTEETLSAYHQARQRQAMLAVITSGGQLGRLAERDRVVCGRAPTGLPP